MKTHRSAGLTLVEVLVALAIIAITLAAGIQASAALSNLAQRQSQQWLAQLCAHNALVHLRLQPDFVALGNSLQTCPQGPHSFALEVQVSPTPNPSFRRVDVSVSQIDPAPTTVPAATPPTLLTLSTVIGRH